MPLVPYLSYTDKHFETAKRFYFLHGPFQIKAVNKNIFTSIFPATKTA